MKLSTVILTKNNYPKLKRTLSSVAFSDEVVVVDDFSDDDTEKLARKFGAKVYRRRLDDDFSKQRNFGLSKAKGEWVLYVDADETVSKELQRDIREALVNSGDFQAFRLLRRNVVMGKTLKRAETGKSRIVRLARRDFGTWKRRIHETWVGSGKIGELKGYLVHDSLKNLTYFIDKINRYSSVHAEEILTEGKQVSLIKVILWPLGKFFYNYFVKLGMLDGLAGFVNVALMSFHSYLSWSKSWLKQRKC